MKENINNDSLINANDSTESDKLKLNKARLNRFMCVLMFTVTNFIFKYISNTYKENGNFLNNSSVLRFGFMCLICRYYSAYENKPLSSVVDFKNKMIHILLRGLFVNCAMIFYATSLNYLKVGVSICINMLNPVFQIIFGRKKVKINSHH